MPVAMEIGAESTSRMPIFLDLSGEIVSKDAIPIAQQIAWRRVPWKRVAELLGGPFRSGMSRKPK